MFKGSASGAVSTGSITMMIPPAAASVTTIPAATFFFNTMVSPIRTTQTILVHSVRSIATAGVLVSTRVISKLRDVPDVSVMAVI